MKVERKNLSDKERDRIARLLISPDFKLLLSVIAARVDAGLVSASSDAIHESINPQSAGFSQAALIKIAPYQEFLVVAATVANEISDSAKDFFTITIHPTSPEDVAVLK